VNAIKVAMCRALCVVDGLNPDEVILSAVPGTPTLFLWQQYISKIEAVLALLYTPSSEMLAAITTNQAVAVTNWQAMLTVVNS
jgi:hypothetical protein